VTPELALPWASLAAAIAAGVVVGGSRPRLETWLRTLALGLLAVFAYFRWLAPDAIPLALTLETIGQATAKPGEGRWRRWSAAFPIAAWLVLGQFFWRSGEGRLAVFTDAGKAALLLALVIGAGLGLRRISAQTEGPRTVLAVASATLVLMGAMALSMDWGLWPALAGTAAILIGQALDLATGGWKRPERRRLGLRLAWALDWSGWATVAYAFVR
jgi:hypothetical protein